MRSGLIFLLCGLLTGSILASDIRSQQDETAGRLIFEIMRIRKAAARVDTEEQRALAGSLSFLFLQLERSKSEGARRALASTFLLDCDSSCAQDRQSAALAHGVLLSKELRTIPKHYGELCAQANASCVDKQILDLRIKEATAMLRRTRGNAIN